MSQITPQPHEQLPDRPFFKWLANRRAFQASRSALRKVHPWASVDVDLYDVLRFFGTGLLNGGVAIRAASISFNLFVAFFPAMILLLSLIPFTPLETGEVIAALELMFPREAVMLLEDTIEEFLAQRQGTLLSVGAILLLYYASNSVNAILVGFGESVHLRDRRPGWLLFRSLSVILLLVLSVLLGLSVFLVGFAGDVLVWAEAKGWLTSDDISWLNFAQWGLAIALIYASVSILYNVGLWTWKGWRLFSIGATTTTLLIVILSLGFSWFIEQFSSYNKLFGSLGTLLVTLVWLNSSSSILLLGFELNAAIRRATGQANQNTIQSK